MNRTTHVLVIDGQNDFCDLPQDWLPRDPLAPDSLLQPQLAVPGAHADLLRVAQALSQGQRGLHRLSFTLDSHHAVGIERTSFWCQADGSPVAPFTEVLADTVRQGRLRPRNPAATGRVLAYLEALQAGGRTLWVWPVHCVQGTWGHNLHAALAQAGRRWEEHWQRPADKWLKGTNPWTEHYSPFRAEVPSADDPATQLQAGLIDGLLESEQVYVMGQASSHCVQAGVQDIAARVRPGGFGRIALVHDGMSPVPGFEAPAQAFLAGMQAQGMRLISAADMAQELAANA